VRKNILVQQTIEKFTHNTTEQPCVTKHSQLVVSRYFSCRVDHPEADPDPEVVEEQKMGRVRPYF